MNANEAPEKIWIAVCGKDLSYEWHSDSEFEEKDHNDIEYTRTDVVIEKACEWLEENLLIYWSQVNANDTEEFIDEFKKAMEE